MCDSSHGDRSRFDIVIIGGGVAGLCCAIDLAAAGKQVRLLEATDRVGGRVRTEKMDGFTLDYGFQTLRTTYPECRRRLDFEALRLRRFDRSMEVFRNGKRVTIDDAPPEQLGSQIAASGTMDWMIPWFVGGEIAVPAGGMAEIPQQLASQLPSETIRLRTSVVALEGTTVHLSDGGRIEANHVVIATDANAASRLLKLEGGMPKWNQTTHLYYRTQQDITKSKRVMRRGEEDHSVEGPIIQSVTVISNVAPEYAPSDQHLIGVTLGNGCEEDLDVIDRAVRDPLSVWLDCSVDRLDRVMMYRIPYGVPHRFVGPIAQDPRAWIGGGPQNVYLCGDHCHFDGSEVACSLDQAMTSGTKAAQALLQKNPPSPR